MAFAHGLDRVTDAPSLEALVRDALLPRVVPCDALTLAADRSRVAVHRRGARLDDDERALLDLLHVPAAGRGPPRGGQ